jgi:hypothetical protein
MIPFGLRVHSRFFLRSFAAIPSCFLFAAFGGCSKGVELSELDALPLPTRNHSTITNHFSLLPYRVAETSTFLTSPAATSTSAEPFSLLASQVTKYLPAGK